MKPRKHQAGVVLILALFFLALAATLSYWMMAKVTRETRSVNLLLRDIQATSYAYGSVAWAQEQLRANYMARQANHIIDEMPMVLPVEEKNNYLISASISDMQGKFNINNLFSNDENQQKQFKKLLQLLLPRLNEQELNQLVLSVTDWVSHNFTDNVSLQNYYLTSSPPYRSPHRIMQSVSELRLVKDITPAIYNTLQPYVTALPPGTRINVLNAEAPVLAALSEDMTLEAGAVIHTLVKEKKIATLEAFMELDPVKSHALSQYRGFMTVESQYFLSEAKVIREKQHLVVYTLLNRVVKRSQPNVQVVWQSLQVPG